MSFCQCRILLAFILRKIWNLKKKNGVFVYLFILSVLALKLSRYSSLLYIFFKLTCLHPFEYLARLHFYQLRGIWVMSSFILLYLFSPLLFSNIFLIVSPLLFCWFYFSDRAIIMCRRILDLHLAN